MSAMSAAVADTCCPQLLPSCMHTSTAWLTLSVLLGMEHTTASQTTQLIMSKGLESSDSAATAAVAACLPLGVAMQHLPFDPATQIFHERNSTQQGTVTIDMEEPAEQLLSSFMLQYKKLWGSRCSHPAVQLAVAECLMDAVYVLNLRTAADAAYRLSRQHDKVLAVACTDAAVAHSHAHSNDPTSEPDTAATAAKDGYSSMQYHIMLPPTLPGDFQARYCPSLVELQPLLEQLLFQSHNEATANESVPDTSSIESVATSPAVIRSTVLLALVRYCQHAPVTCFKGTKDLLLKLLTLLTPADSSPHGGLLVDAALQLLEQYLRPGVLLEAFGDGANVPVDQVKVGLVVALCCLASVGQGPDLLCCTQVSMLVDTCGFIGDLFSFINGCH